MLNYLRLLERTFGRKRLSAVTAAALSCAALQTASAQPALPSYSRDLAPPASTGQLTFPPNGNMAPSNVIMQAPLRMQAPFQTSQQPQFPQGYPAGMIQQVQNTPQSARAVHRLIEKLPEAQDDMEIIERRSQLVVTRSNVLRMAIGDQSIIDIVQYSPKEFSIIGLGRGATTLTLWFEGEADPLIYTIRTIRDPSLNKQREIDYGQLEQKLAKMYPNSKVYLIPFSWKIVVRGQARDQEEASHILNIIRGEVINQSGGMLGNFPGATVAGGYAGGYGGGDVGTGIGNWGNNFWSSFIINELRVPGEYTIGLRIRVAELNRSQLDQAGVDLNILWANARQALSSTMGGVPGTLSGVFENGQIGIFLNYLITNGTAKTLTEPQVTVLSGRTARLLSGGEYAVPTVVGVGGAQSTTTSFRGFGTSLLVTPVVVDRDLIRISVVAEYSNLDPANNVNGIPGTDTRRVSTEVELREGQTLALAGLLSHGMTSEISRIPLLGDLPLVGPLLFSTKKMTQEENELLVLLTPEIMRPMDASEVPPVPGFEVTKPSHTQFWKYNMTEGPPDVGYYHSPPYGSGSTGTNVDYQQYNPGPAGSMYSPVPTTPSGIRGAVPQGPLPPQGMPMQPGMAPQGMPMQPGMGPQGMPVQPGYSTPGIPGQPGLQLQSQPMPNSSTSPGRLSPIPQASRYDSGGNAQGYSNQVMMPANNGVRQTGWQQPPASNSKRWQGQGQ